MRRRARARPPGGSSRQLRNVRIEIRQGLQLEGEFQPSSFLSSLSGLCISGPRLPPWSSRLRVFILFLLKGEGVGGWGGHAGRDIRA